MFYKYKELQPIINSRILVIKENKLIVHGTYRESLTKKGEYYLSLNTSSGVDYIFSDSDTWCYIDKLIEFSEYVLKELDELTNKGENDELDKV